MRVASALFILGCLLSMASAQSCAAAIQAQTAPTSARIALERMSPAERANSRISVEFESSDGEALALGHRVEKLWNGGQHDEALAELRNLEARVGHVAIGNSWRTAVPTLAADSWGMDVRIGNRDSLLGISIALDPTSGNLFAVLRHSGGPPHWSVCMSPDHGATWDETFTWIGSPTTCLVAAVLWRLFVVYDSPGEDPRLVRVRRFVCDDGSADTFQTDQYWVAACTLNVGDTMKEASLVPFWTYGRLYGTFLVSDGSVLLRWANPYGSPWHADMGIASDASSGLDAAGDGDTDTLYFCDCDTTDTLRIYRWTWDGLRLRCSIPAEQGISTSISTYHDTVICAYEDETSSPSQVRYAINYGDGDTWTMGTLSNADTAADSPGVFSREGKFAAVFRHCAPTRELRFCQRPYLGSWSDTVSIADNEPCHGRPEIVYMGSGVYGVAYLSDTSPVVRGAYFDKSGSPYSLAEQRQPQVSSHKPQATLVRGSLLLEKGSSTSCLLDISGRNMLDLHPGVNDVSKLAPGVYFVRAASRRPSAVSCSKVVVTR